MPNMKNQKCVMAVWCEQSCNWLTGCAGTCCGFDTPAKNIYWRLGAGTDLKDVFAFMSQFGICNWNCCTSYCISWSQELFELWFFKTSLKAEINLENCVQHLLQLFCFPCPLSWPELRATPLPREMAKPLPWLYWASECVQNNSVIM